MFGGKYQTLAKPNQPAGYHWTTEQRRNQGGTTCGGSALQGAARLYSCPLPQPAFSFSSSSKVLPPGSQIPASERLLLTFQRTINPPGWQSHHPQDVSAPPPGTPPPPRAPRRWDFLSFLEVTLVLRRMKSNRCELMMHKLEDPGGAGRAEGGPPGTLCYSAFKPL